MHLHVPELTGEATGVLRIPAQQDVHVTPRVSALLDTPAMQRLKHISQLGLVSQVYPGALHSRFEHSLGVYHLACKLLRHLLVSDCRLAESVTEQEAKVFLAAALMHDVGHWPFCHPIEDMRLEWIPKHETHATAHLTSGPVADVLQRQWGIQPEQVCDFLNIAGCTAGQRILQNVLNGPVDIDKMDYLVRDSLHAGVPYGNNFDCARLINSLCIDHATSQLAITGKGKTAAEMMVFARYVMFSEVYWQHAVRSATAMLQRLVFGLGDDCRADLWSDMTDAAFIQLLLEHAEADAGLRPLAHGLFGTTRRLYKRLGQFSYSDFPELFDTLAGRPYAELVGCSERLAAALRERFGVAIETEGVLIDAPPVKLEVQFRLSVLVEGGDDAESRFVPLAQRSPVVRALATEQFDNFVKQIRVFVSPSTRQALDIPAQQLASLMIDNA